MSNINSRRKGLALGAISALVAGLFGAIPASAAPSTTAFTIVPAGADTTNFSTLVTEDFTIITQRDASLVTSTDMNSQLKYSISTNRTWNNTLSMTVIAGVASNNNVEDVTALAADAGNTLYYNGVDTGNSSTISGTVGATEPATYSYVLAPQAGDVDPAQSNKLSIRLNSATTLSAAVNVTVTAFLDLNSNNIFDSTTEPSGTQTIAFKPWSAVAPTVTMAALENGNTHLTASAAISGLNFDQLGGKFVVRFSAFGQPSAISYSATAELAVTTAKAAAGFVSSSVVVTAVTAGQTYSAQVGYIASGNILGADGTTENVNARFWAPVSQTVAAAGASNIVIDEVVSSNLSATGEARPNATYTVRTGARTASNVVSASAIAITYTFGGTSLSTTKTLAVNGGSAATVSHNSVVVRTGTNGLADVSLVAAGFEVGDKIAVTASAVGRTAVGVVLTMAASTWTLENDSDLLATAPGTAVSVGVTVVDQWGVNSARTDQRVKFVKSAPFDDANTISYVVVAGGVAAASITPSPATKTGSMTVTPSLQTYNQNTGNYDATGATATAVTVTVTSATNGFRTGLAASYSASISYGVDLSWSAEINAAYVVVTGSQVVVSGAGLIFKDSAGATASDSITLDGTTTARVSFYVTARKAGTYTVTLTAGAATTTSQIVVFPARDNDGASIVFDTTAITAGSTRIVTGTVLDANGNPVDTTLGNATIAITVKGTAGVAVGSIPTETDEDGNFAVSILSGVGDLGTFTIMASYLMDGANTAAADKVTATGVITIGPAAAASTPSTTDAKVNVGSFKGYVALYAKGYEGKKMSAIVAGKWIVVDSLASGFERVVRFTGAGYDITVKIYIDGALVDTFQVMTK